MNHPKRYLGIDIGGTTAKYAIISAEGDISEKGSFDTGVESGFSFLLDSLISVVDAALIHGIDGIGICSLGIIHPRTGEIIGGIANLPYLKGLNLKKLLSEKYRDIPVHVSNDVKAVARGEQWMGAGKDCENFFCITFGTGVGGALVLDSRVVEGAHFRAGEIGYLDYNSETSYFEKNVSTKSVMKFAADRLGMPFIDGIEFFQRVRAGQPECLDILDEWIGRIARFIANVIIIFDVEKVILGGGISSELDILLHGLSHRVEKMLPLEFCGQTVIDTAKCENNAGMLGAVWPLIDTAQRL